MARLPVAPVTGSEVDASEPVLRVEALRKSFGRNRPEALAGIDLTVRRGELVVVLGANGSGKSTLLRCAVGLVTADSGRVVLEGQDMVSLRGSKLRAARRQAAVVFQRVALVRRRDALENVCMGGFAELPLSRSASSALFPRQLRDRAANALARVGLPEVAWQQAGTLSGGQAQRVSIARALCQEATIVMADEPVSALDPRAADDVLKLLAQLAREDHLAVLCVLHQPELARAYADRIVGMRAGAVVFDRATDAVSGDDIERLYDGEVPGGDGGAVVTMPAGASGLERLPPRPRRTTPQRAAIALGALTLIGLTIFAWIDIGGSFAQLRDGLFSGHGISDILSRSVPPKTGGLWQWGKDAIVTFSVALIGTLIAIVGSLVLAPLAARNITPHRLLYEAARLIAAVTRSIHELIWALLFIPAFGLGAFTGMMALAFHSIGVLSKLYAEAIEEMDMAPIDALRVTGASRSQVFLHGVIPGIKSTLIGLTLYRSDTNFRSAVALGAVGGGGIGFDINQSLQLFQYREVFSQLVIVVVLVLVIERASAILRARLASQ